MSHAHSCPSCNGALVFGAMRIRGHEICADCILRGSVHVGNIIIETKTQAEAIRQGWRRHRRLWDKQFNHPVR